MQTIRNLKRQLEKGEVSASDLIEQSLDRIAEPEGQGGLAFLHVSATEARQVAGNFDSIRSAGGAVPPFAGIPVAVKDLCDIAGQVTKAGSVVLNDSEPAHVDATVVSRLRSAGFVIIGRTNMTEFAYSGLGFNSHYGTPSSPWGRESAARIPGGSSSGTAVAVADGMAVAGLGTDTGGSCRIPAAFCGIVGYKPTARRVPLDGIFPLAPSLDSVGPLANSVDCCQIIDDIFAGGTGIIEGLARPADRIRLAAITDYVLDDLDPEVARLYAKGLDMLSSAGVAIIEVPFPELHDLAGINRSLVVAEAFAVHQHLLDSFGDSYDPHVRIRLEPGAQINAADLLEAKQRRIKMVGIARRKLAGFDAFVLPTVATLAPTIDSFSGGDADYYSSKNVLCLRNASVGNFLDSCSISIPVSAPGEPPIGLMLMGNSLQDTDLFRVARTVEKTIDPSRT